MTGCISPTSPVGVVAVGGGADGRPVLLVESCGETVTDVELTRVDVSASGAVVGRWRPLSGRGDDALDVAAPAMSWDVVSDPGPLDPTGEYRVRALTADFMTAPTDFTLDDVSGLGDGRVLRGPNTVHPGSLDEWC